MESCVNESCSKSYQITLRKLNEVTCNESTQSEYVCLRWFSLVVVEDLQTIIKLYLSTFAS